MSDNGVDDLGDMAFDILRVSSPLLDRSTLEAWGICPRQAYFRQQITDVSIPALAGSRCHEALSAGVTVWFQGRGTPTVDELETDMRYVLTSPFSGDSMVAMSEACDSLRYTLRPFAWWLHNTYPSGHGIIRWDGGEGERSGQLAYQLDAATVTAELDLLSWGVSREQMIIRDWKTGHKHWTAGDVRDAFQFKCYAWLVLLNYPDVAEVLVSVWNARRNIWTPSVSWTRKNIDGITRQIEQAICNWQAYKDAKDANNVPAIPTADACRICPALTLCDVKTPSEAVLSVDQGRTYVAAIRQREEQLKAMHEAATKWCKQHGDLPGYGEKPKSRATYGLL